MTLELMLQNFSVESEWLIACLGIGFAIYKFNGYKEFVLLVD